MKAIKTLFFMILCSLMIPTLSYAKTTELTAQYDKASGKYRIDIEDTLFSIENLEGGKTYESSILFKNDTEKLLTISLEDVNNLLSDSRLYDISKISFSDSQKNFYTGDMDNAKFRFTMSPNTERLLSVTYHIDEFPHLPDNSLMGAKMHSEFIFVGTFDRIGSGGSQVIASGYTPETSESGIITTPNGNNPPSPTRTPDGDGTQNGTGNSKTPTVTVKIPKTGDEFPILPLLFLLGISGAGLILSLRKKKVSHFSEK